MIENAAAYTSVAKAEREPTAVHAIKAEAIERIEQLAEQITVWLVYCPNDYIFDRGKPERQLQFDTPNPQSTHSRIKLEG